MDPKVPSSDEPFSSWSQTTSTPTRHDAASAAHTATVFGECESDTDHGSRRPRNDNRGRTARPCPSRDCTSTAANQRASSAVSAAPFGPSEKGAVPASPSRSSASHFSASLPHSHSSRRRRSTSRAAWNRSARVSQDSCCSSRTTRHSRPSGRTRNVRSRLAAPSRSSSTADAPASPSVCPSARPLSAAVPSAWFAAVPGSVHRGWSSAWPSHQPAGRGRC